jgi:hypothetical protein
VSRAEHEIAKIRGLIGLHHDADTEILRRLARLEEDIERRCCDHECDAPAHITLTASTSPEGTPMASYTLGVPVYFTAAVENAEQVPVADALSWSATAGTVSADPANPLWATLVNAPLGDVTVTATTSNGLTATDTVTIVDNVPATVSLTDSAAPNTPAA